ncbi:MAG: M23 family metallopeptidase [Clostridia bacterium]|nr:M23 family metallopeptidase [Clostridia bacterium]
MNKSTGAKRQARAIIVTAVLIAAIAAVIIFTGVQQSRRGSEKMPPDSISTAGAETTRRDTNSTTGVKTDPKEEARPPEITKPESEASAVTEEASPVAADPLPDFIAPVSGMVSKAYSVDVPVYSLTMEDYRAHTGVDIAASLGTAVRATAAGTVGEIWEDPMMGTCLSVVHSGGAKSVYKNLAPTVADGIAAGAAVKAGTVLGAVGESALAEIAESSHLHYELEIDGVRVNPADFMLLGTEDTAYEG